MKYVQMPRTATSHTMKLLDYNFPNHKIEHSHEPLTIRPDASELVFGSIRDPLSWYMSFWFANSIPQLGYLYGHKERPAHFKTFMRELDAPEIRRCIDPAFEHYKGGLYSFYVEKLYKMDGDWLVTKFIRLENYQETLEELVGPVRAPKKLRGKIFNKSLIKDECWDFFSDEMRAKVFEQDGPIAAHFGYKP